MVLRRDGKQGEERLFISLETVEDTNPRTPPQQEASQSFDSSCDGAVFKPSAILITRDDKLRKDSLGSNPGLWIAPNNALCFFVAFDTRLCTTLQP